MKETDRQTDRQTENDRLGELTIFQKRRERRKKPTEAFYPNWTEGARSVRLSERRGQGKCNAGVTQQAERARALVALIHIFRLTKRK